MLFRLKRLVSRPIGCAALAMAALVSGCGGAGPLESDRVFSGNVFSSNHLKPKDYPIHGIDVSKFQGDIDWNAVAYSGVKFAWIKATEGGDRADARFQANWEGGQGRWHPPWRLSLRLLVPSAARGNQLLRTECASRGRRAPAGARRRGDANLTDLPPPCRPRRGHRRHAGHAAGDGAPLPQAADHLYDRRFLRGESFQRRVDGLSDLGARPNTILP